MSYISPIKLNTIPDMEEGWTDKIAKYIAGETDKLVLESCVKVACDVDEEELLKALQYDRGQYEKGYADGKRDAAPRWVRCEDELPRKTRKFVVWVPVNNGPYPCWYEERTALWQAVEKKWYVDHNPKTWWVGEPTHWMPIEPPKEDA